MELWNTLSTAAVDRIGPLLPGVLHALLILALAWLIARVARALVLRLGRRLNLDERLSVPGLSALLASIAHAVAWLIALPAVLDALGLQVLLEPLNAMMARLLGILPNVLGALAIFGVGFLIARIARQVVGGVLTAAGSEQLAARLGLNQALGEHTLADLVGRIALVLVLLPTLAAALQTLGLEAISQPVTQLLNQVTSLVPRLIAAAVILAVGAVLGRLLATLVSTLLAGAGANRLPQWLGLSPKAQLGGREPAELGGMAAMAAVLLLAIVQASQVLGIPVLADAVGTLGGLLSNLFVAAVVLAVGLWLAALAGRTVAASPWPRAALLGRLVQAAVVVFAGALALRQAGLPADIVTIAFGALVGSLALATAIALGLGGREVGARLWGAAADALLPPARNAAPPADREPR